jgi:hypothetical protein
MSTGNNDPRSLMGERQGCGTTDACQCAGD